MTDNSVKFVDQDTIVSDDLSKILGINNAIAFLLNKSHIHNFKDLAQTPYTRIYSITSKINPPFRDSWQEQARLASEYKWHRLREFQYQLRTHTGTCRVIIHSN